MLKSICVFCGSNPGVNGRYAATARELGRLLAGRGVRLVYGGGVTGIMGELAEGALAAGGEVVGVIPEAMTKVGVAHFGVSDLRVVDSMYTRKALMFELSDAFVALPGGLGTYDELFEALTFSQLGYRPRPIGVLNVERYFDPFVRMVDHAVAEGFMKAEQRGIFVVAHEAGALLDDLAAFQHPAGFKWTELPDA